MSFPRTLGMVAGLVFVASAANAQDKEIPTLEGSEAIQAIIGSTITTAGGPDGPVSMYVGSDHTFDSIKKGEISSGEWFEKNHLFCIKHESPCTRVLVDGTVGYLSDPSGKDPVMFTIKAGNQVDHSAAKD